MIYFDSHRSDRMTSTPTRPVDNVVIATKGLQDRNINIIAGTTVENKGKLILTEVFVNQKRTNVCEHTIKKLCVLIFSIKHNACY